MHFTLPKLQSFDKISRIVVAIWLTLLVILTSQPFQTISSVGSFLEDFKFVLKFIPSPLKRFSKEYIVHDFCESIGQLSSGVNPTQNNSFIKEILYSTCSEHGSIFGAIRHRCFVDQVEKGFTIRCSDTVIDILCTISCR